MTRPLLFCLVLLGLLLTARPSHAQPEPYYFSLPDAAKAEAVPGAATANWYVARVHDARPDRSRLGTVRRGLDNLPAPAMLTQPVTSAVLAFCRQQLPPRPGSQPVVLRLLAFSVGEDVRPTSENGEAELIGDFLLPQSDSSFRVLLPVAEFVRRGGLDVTLHHSANLGGILTRALGQLAALPAPTSPTPPLSRADALAGRGTAPFPVQAQTPVAGEGGFYRTFADFRANIITPASRAFELKPTPRSLNGKLGNAEELEAYYFYLSAEEPRELIPLADIWGLTDGHQRYVVQRNRLYPLLPGPDGRSFTFTAPAPVDMAGSASRALAGGLVGGAVGAGLAAASGPNAGLATYELHLPTGRLLAQDETFAASGFADVNPEAGILYLFRRADNVSAEPLLVQRDGRTIASLLPQQYVRLAAPGRQQELVLCLQRPTATAPTPEAARLLQAAACLPVAPDRAAPIYIECVAAPGPMQVPALRAVTTRTGNMQIKRMKLVE
jgi:hypothetical protein